MKTLPQILIALLILIGGGVTALAIVRTESEIKPENDVRQPPQVSVMTARPRSLKIDVRSQGSVKAHTEIDLVAEVTGRIIKVSPAFVNGGFFKKGEVLLAVDPLDYDLKIAQAEAGVMEAKHQLAKEEAEAELARKDWRKIGHGEPGALPLHLPQLAALRARLASAQAELKNAQILKQRTVIRAPFDGRIREAAVGLGQYISNSSLLASVFGTDLAEIRLPVSTRELAFIDLDDTKRPNTLPKVALSANYRGQKRTWHGQIVRSEGVIDAKTGMMTLVARVLDPYSLLPDNPNPPLPVGLFVEALIEGRPFDGLVDLPSGLILNGHQIAVVDSENHIRFRSVEILHNAHERVFIRSGLQAGESVLSAGLLHPAEGMLVAPVGEHIRQNPAVAETALPSAS